MSETYYFLYSKYSVACNQIMPIVKGFSNYINISPIDIDDKQTRSKLAKTVIKTVPAIIVHAPDRIYVLERQELQAFLQRINTLINSQVQQQQQLLAANAGTNLMPTQVQSIAPPPNAAAPVQNEAMSVTASINSRLAPQLITSPAPPPPALTTQVNSGQTSVVANAQMQQQQRATASTNPMEAAAQAEAALQAATQQTQMQQTQMQPFQQMISNDVQIIDDSALMGEGSTFTTDGAYTPEMIGSGSSANRAVGNHDQRSSAMKSQAEQWMKERDEADKQYQQRPMM